LAGLRTRLAEHRSIHPLFDTARFVRNLKAAYRQMHQHWRRGLPPEAFAVVKAGAGHPQAIVSTQ
jgi:hypothetical protein